MGGVNHSVVASPFSPDTLVFMETVEIITQLAHDIFNDVNAMSPRIDTLRHHQPHWVYRPLSGALTA